jgi:hypothetical protein
MCVTENAEIGLVEMALIGSGMQIKGPLTLATVALGWIGVDRRHHVSDLVTAAGE